MPLLRSFILLIPLLVSLPLQASPVVKMSSSKICHDEHSRSYNRTKNFTPYPSLDECLKAGGRLPKGYTPPSQSPANDARYSRDQFGHGWADDDHDCINTRHEILQQQSTSTVSTGKNKCTVERGRWLDPYTGQTFYMARDLDIDHLVPLEWAWRHGADGWTDDQRKKFANDPANLFAVKASVNRAKGSKDPSEWLPPDSKFHCQYVTRFIRVMKTYQLQLSDSEQAAFNRIREQSCSR